MMPLLQNARVSARQLEKKLVAPLPKSKSRRKSRRRLPPNLSLLHQHDKKRPDKQLLPVLQLHPLLRQSNLLVSREKVLFNKLPPKLFNVEIFHPLFPFVKKMRTWTLLLDLERLVQFLELKALLMAKEKAPRARLVLPRVHTSRPPKKYRMTKLVNWTWPDNLKLIWPPWKKKKNPVLNLSMMLFWLSLLMLLLLNPLPAKQKLMLDKEMLPLARKFLKRMFTQT